MPLSFTQIVLLALPYGIMSLVLVALGMYALIRRRPFVIDARWMNALSIVLLVSPLVVMLSLVFVAHRWSEAAMFLIVTLISIFCLGYLALVMRGYTVYGATQSSFREALVATLSNLHLEFEEGLSSIRLPSVPAELQVAVQGWIGTGQLRLRNGGRPGLLADVAGGMNAYFNAARVKTNMTTAVTSVILGLLSCAMVCAMVVATLKLVAR